MSEQDNPEFFDPVDEINRIISSTDRIALPSIYEKVQKLDVVGEGKALVASANARALPTRRVGKFEMLEVLERSLNRTVLNLANPGERVFTALRELSDFLNMATTGAKPKVADAHRDLLPVGHPLSTREHNFSQQEVAQFHAEWMSADPRIAEAFRPLVASAFIAPASSLEREYVIAKLEATPASEVPRDIILGLTADGGDPYGGGNSFLARSTRAKAQRRDRRGRFAYMGGGARIWLGKQFSARSTLFRFAGYNSQNDSFDLEGLPNTPYQGKIISVPASKVEAIKAILPEIPGLKSPASKSVAKDIIVDPSSLELRDAPTGWTKVSSENGVDTFRSADGWIATRYPDSASAPNEPSIKRVRGANVDKSIDPDLPVYHIAKGSNDGLVTDKPFAVTQSWGDTQALISRYDKKTDPKPKATLEEQPEEFLEGWTKGVYQVVKSDNENPYIIAKEDTADGKTAFTDPSGRYVAIKLATVLNPNWGADAQGAKDVKDRGDSRTRSQVLDSGKPIETFDGAQKWDGNVENLYRLERVKSDGRREVIGFYQDPDDIERDTEVPPVEDKSNDFYQNVIADTLQNGGNTIDFVDGNAPEDGYIIAHEPDVLRQDGTLGKREEVIKPEDFADPIEGPKLLRAFVLKNQDKLTKQGFYLGTWKDTVDVTDENGKVTGQREMVFLDVSEYERDFDKAFDMSEARKEIAYYGVSEGKSFYTADEKRRREIIRKTPKLDQAEKARLKQVHRDAQKAYGEWQKNNKEEYWALSPKGLLTARLDEKGYSMPNPRLEQENKELYDLYFAEYEAQVAYGEYEANYLRSIFEMEPSGFGQPRRDPGGEGYGFGSDQGFLRIRNKYVAEDTTTVARNENLRNGGEPTPDDIQMDFLIRQSKLKDDTAFYRGINLDPELVKELTPGDTYHSRAFSSMALDKEVALVYVNGRQPHTPDKVKTVFRMLCPKGMNAIHVGGNEVVLPRNTKMRIIRKSEVDGITYFDVDVEPQTKEEINARIQGRVPRPEPSESSSKLPGDDGGGTDGLGDGGPFPVNYSPKSTVEGPEQAPRVTDPNNAIWLSLAKDELGVTLNDIIDEAITINQYNDPEKHLARRLKKNVAESITEKLRNVDNEEFLEMAVSLKMHRREDLFWDDESLKDIGSIPVAYQVGGEQNTSYGTIADLVTSRPMGDTLPQDLIDRLNTGKISRKDAKEVVRLMNESGRAPYSDIVFVNKDSEESMYILREKVASDLVAQWASTSNGGQPMSLAIQDLAFKEFDIDRPAEWKVEGELKDQISEIKNNHENLIRKFLRAQYEMTQEYFQKKGISKVTLYRGIRNFTAHDMKKSTFPSSKGFTASIRLRPMSSWSTSEGVAVGFARGADSKIFRKEYDVKDIIAFPGTGVGCYDEREMVVLGGVTDSVDVADYNPQNTPSVVYNSPEPQPITYKKEQPQIQVNNAPVDLSRIPPDDGGDEPDSDSDPDEINIFDLENPDYTKPGFYKFEIVKNLAATDEMQEVSDSEIVDLSDWFNLFSTDELEWGENGKRAVGSIRLLSLDRSEFGEGEWGGDYEFTDLLYDIEQNINFGGVEPFKKGSVLKRVMDGYIAGEDPEISKEELAQFFKDYSKHFDEDITDSYLVPSIEDEQFMKLLREEVVSNLVHVWAETSNGDHPMSHALQDIAKTVLGVEDSADWENGKTQDQKDELFNAALEIKENYGEALRALVKAQYRLTQEWLEDRGIEKLVVYRGIREPKGVDNKKGLVQLRPLSSWSQNQRVALKFTGGVPNQTGGMLRTVIDAKDVFSTPFTGFGCLDEDEIVVIGGKKTAEMRSVQDVWGGWTDKPEAQPQIQVNNAPISNAPKKPMSNTERKRLEREQRKAEEAVAPSPEQIKEEIKQAQQELAQVAQALPVSVDDFFDPNNPLNILGARNITNEITGTNVDRDNLSKDEILRQKILFMEPTKEWYDLLDQVEKSGTPIAREIISKMKKNNSRLIQKVREAQLEERQAQIEYETASKDILNVVNTLVNNALTRPNDVPSLNAATSDLMTELDEYFGGNPNNKSLENSNSLFKMALMSVYATNNPDIAKLHPDFNIDDVAKVVSDLISQVGSAYARYGNSSATPDRNALTKEIQKIYIKSFFGGVNPADMSNTIRILSNLSNINALDSILPKDIISILADKSKVFSRKRKNLQSKRIDSLLEKEDLAKRLAKTTKEVLSENGLEFDHGVEVSSQDVNWSGVHNFKFGVDSQNNLEFQPTQVPDDEKQMLAPELKNVNGAIDILNQALQAYPKPVALALRQFLIDNKSDFSFFTTSRGVTVMVNKDKMEEIHDVGDLSGVIKRLGISGTDRDGAVETTVHELLHLIVNGIFRNEMNSIAWAKQSRETNNVSPDGKISHDFVDGNYGNVAYPPSGNYLTEEDLMRMIKTNELGAASPNFASPYIGKYGNAAAAQAGIGQSPFSHGELLSTLFESLLGGGVTGLLSTSSNPKRVMSGTNPDGSPRYITIDDSVFSESMIPFGVSMIVVLNELAKRKLKIA